jgi:RND family efflux transporter MFP subunit
MSTAPPNISDLRINRGGAPSRETGRGRLVAFALVALAVTAGLLWFLRVPRAIAVQTATATVTGGAVAGGAGISANGYVVARTKASVSAKIAGRMEYLGVTEGSRVKKGQVIARIESGIYGAQVEAAQAQIGEARAQLAQAERDLERAQTLRKQDLIPLAELENVATRVEVLKAGINTARAQKRVADATLENTLVRAPFDGTILRKDAEVGEIVSPASAGGGLTRTAIVTMADLGTLEVEVDVNEAYIARIENGDAARITLDAYSDTSFAGRVRQVVPTADRQKATVLVKVAILDRDPRILPEMGAKVVFATDPGTPATTMPVRITVPLAAVVRGTGGARVWVIEKDRAIPHAVELGRDNGDSIEIRSGLSGGESVVLQPPADLTEGARVRSAQ